MNNRERKHKAKAKTLVIIATHLIEGGAWSKYNRNKYIFCSVVLMNNLRCSHALVFLEYRCMLALKVRDF